MERDSILTATHPRSGARYFTSFLPANFKEYINFTPFQIQDNTQYPSHGKLLKTHILNQHEFPLDMVKFYIVRDYRDIAATLIKDDKADPEKVIMYNIPLWKEHVEHWLKNDSVTLIKFEDILNNPIRILKFLSEKLELEPTPNNTRSEEIISAERDIGFYRDFLSLDQLAVSEELVKDTLELVNKRIQY